MVAEFRKFYTNFIFGNELYHEIETYFHFRTVPLHIWLDLMILNGISTRFRAELKFQGCNESFPTHHQLNVIKLLRVDDKPESFESGLCKSIDC